MEIYRAGNRPDVWHRTRTPEGSESDWVCLGGEILIARFSGTEEFDSGSVPGNVLVYECPTLPHARRRWPQEASLWDAVQSEYEEIDSTAEKAVRDHSRFFCMPY